MAITTRWDRIDTPDGTFEAYCAVPDGGRGPGVLVFQEIFGVNDNMRGLAERLAGAGYVALVPDMFWRLEPRFERKDESGMGDGIALVQRFDWVQARADIAAAHAHLLALPECTGKVGAMGFCLGGGLAFVAAAHSRVDGRGPDAAVPYYGSAIGGMLDDVARIDCPLLLHYGANDPFIPTEAIDAVEQAVAVLPDATLHRYDAGHAFSNWDAPSMYDEAAAELAWSRTLDFLGRHLA